MTLETLLKNLVEAVQENTAVHREFTAIAVKATGAKTAEAPKAEAEAEADDAEAEAEAEAEDEAAAKKSAAAKKAAATRKAAAEKKAAEEKAAAKRADADIEIAGSVAKAELTTLLKGYLDPDNSDEEEVKARKKNLSAAFQHLGIKKLNELEDDVERAKLAAYVAHWGAGADTVDFDAVDGLVADAGSDAGSDDDDLGLDD